MAVRQFVEASSRAWRSVKDLVEKHTTIPTHIGEGAVSPKRVFRYPSPGSQPVQFREPERLFANIKYVDRQNVIRKQNARLLSQPFDYANDPMNVHFMGKNFFQNFKNLPPDIPVTVVNMEAVVSTQSTGDTKITMAVRQFVEASSRAWRSVKDLVEKHTTIPTHIGEGAVSPKRVFRYPSPGSQPVQFREPERLFANIKYVDRQNVIRKQNARLLSQPFDYANDPMNVHFMGKNFFQNFKNLPPDIPVTVVNMIPYSYDVDGFKKPLSEFLENKAQ
eukprot:TRINITY_DN1192_c0_g1_i2.p1 TRINITY_DN1192_c0_g1~~TRINITY_DN1192_c0_g1_i2.p1  ORF type:complete len:300 (+),score=51.53 TRINITY_DN1192_c0_g1_i2:70-900(+)